MYSDSKRGTGLIVGIRKRKLICLRSDLSVFKIHSNYPQLEMGHLRFDQSRLPGKFLAFHEETGSVIAILKKEKRIYSGFYLYCPEHSELQWCPGTWTRKEFSVCPKEFHLTICQPTVDENFYAL